jgi:hypothetical protein
VRRPPATEAQVAVLAARFGPLPEDYRHFLTTVNGGAPVPDFLEHPAGYPFAIECFNSLCDPGEPYSIEAASAWLSDVLERPVVALAGNGFGDHLILIAPGDPAIYQWVHDEDGAPVRMASSFTELLSLLVPRPTSD